jgi:competence protein ComEC
MIAGIITLLAAICVVREWSLLPDGRLHLRFFDVGQGDAALIEFPEGGTMLIDGGPDASTLRELGKTMPFMNRHIDIIALSHPNIDHLASLPEVLRRYSVKTLIMSVSGSTMPTMRELGAAAATHGTTVFIASAGQVLPLQHGASLSVLWPPAHPPASFRSDVNDLSLVLVLSYGQHRALFTGDASEKIERVLLRANTDVHAEILKVAHHGSKSATTPAFLGRVHPAVAVISVGKENPYGHPSPEVLRRLVEAHIDVRRTDERGTIDIVW